MIVQKDTNAPFLVLDQNWKILLIPCKRNKKNLCDISTFRRRISDEFLRHCCNGNGKRERQKSNKIMKQNNNLQRASCFFLHFLPSLHDYEVKMPNFKFYLGRKQATSKFFLKWCFRCRRLRLPDCFESSLHCDNIVANKTVLVTSL